MAGQEHWMSCIACISALRIREDGYIEKAQTARGLNGNLRMSHVLKGFAHR